MYDNVECRNTDDLSNLKDDSIIFYSSLLPKRLWDKGLWIWARRPCSVEWRCSREVNILDDSDEKSYVFITAWSLLPQPQGLWTLRSSKQMKIGPAVQDVEESK